MKNLYNIGYYPGSHSYLRNRLFDVDHPMNVTGNLDKWIVVKKFLAERNINFNTYDIYKNFKEIDVWLIPDPKPSVFKFMLVHGISPRKVIPILQEPPVVNPWAWKHLRLYSRIFRVVLMWHSELCSNNEKYLHYYFPVKFDEGKYSYYKAKSKKNLCLLMHSNKVSRVPGELYSLRRNIITYFEKRGDNLLDLYGHRWNDEKDSHPFFTTLYKGIAQDKRETFAEYYFTFCIDNSVVPGYITYDPLISMATGSVPIYLPMPDSSEYIPENTFINYNNFKNLDELVSYLQSLIHTSKYEEYRERGWAFLNSKKYYPFTMEKFCEDIYAAIKHIR